MEGLRARIRPRRTTPRLLLATVIGVLALVGGPVTAAQAAPTVAIESPQNGDVINNTTPSFSGFASDSTDVLVKIFHDGSLVASATAEGTGAGWSSGAASPELPEGHYTAYAEQTSSGEETGKSETIGFSVVTAAPQVTLGAVPSPSGEAAPSFTGTASDQTPISILIYRGGTASGELVASAGASGTGGAWSSGHASPNLADGEYTAVAIQESSLLGNPTGVSNEVSFIVDTRPPSVSLNGVSSPSKNTSPTFTGTADDSTTVTVHVFDEAQQEVAKATASPSDGSWKSGGLSKSLPSGSYTAIATEPSSVNNANGESARIEFVVNTQPPHVTLEQPARRSSNTAPSFSGTASENSTVTVSVYAGSSVTGTPVTRATAAGTGGPWTSGPVETALSSGTYTAVAEQTSTLENPDGVSETRTFTVDTSAPAVTLAQPPARSGNAQPSFSGTASETTPVTISVYAGANVTTGVPLTEATATGTGGAWSSGPVGAALSSGTYTAVARQPSAIGNLPGVSEAWTFQIDTSSPKVTLNQPSSPSNKTSPSFSGTAAEPTEVDVHVLLGGQQVQEYETTAAAGAWKTGPVSPALPAGAHEYRVYATEVSALGNAPGRSSEYALTVNTDIGLAEVPSPSNNRTPSFSGTAVESKAVVVHVLQEGREVTSATATPSGGHWSTGPLSHPLGVGRNQYTAYASQAATAESAEGRSATVSFLLDTTPPEVALDPVPAASSDATPSFSGTTSQHSEEVEVRVYRGHSATGTPVATVTTRAGSEVSPGVWSWSTPEIPSLGARAGTYTAIARQRSAIGNPEGESKQSVFLVDPELPALTMTPVRSQIDTAAPSFTGTSDQSQPVEVQIYARSARSQTCEVEGPALSTARSATGGAWTTGAAGPALPEGSYAAVARQPTAIPSDPRQAATAPSCFSIDTAAPAVSLTAPSPGTVLGSGSVTASGSAGAAAHDLRQVTVQLFAGEGVGATPLQQVVVSSSAGSWSAVLSGLAPGSYTVRAEQSDEAGNVGLSSASTFWVGAATAASSSLGPTAHFSWFPAHPHVGEAISLVSDSLDPASPLSGYAWALDSGALTAGASSTSAKFTTAGQHVVRLRVIDAAGRSGIVSESIPVSYPLMRPFPLVRIVTTRTIGRVRLEVLSVRAPAGAGVEVSCTGRGCPLRSQLQKVRAAHKAAVPAVTFARFERSLPPGVALHIRVFKAGMIGKYTLFTIRRGKLPVRSDSCVSSTDPKPLGCPT
jgi:hypothetical protein